MSKDKENFYFAIIDSKRKHFLFDFNLDENLDVYINDTIVNEDNVFKAMDDAVLAYENKASSNKKLRLINNIEDEDNKMFKSELEKIASLLNI